MWSTTISTSSIKSYNLSVSLYTVSCSMDPVVTQVGPNSGDDPGPDGVPGQLVDAVVVVNVDVEPIKHTLRQHSGMRNNENIILKINS